MPVDLRGLFQSWPVYRQLTGGFRPLFDPYSLGGMILIEGFLWSPLVFLLMSSTFRAANAEMEEAARMSGATVFRTIWTISIKMAKPSILALALFVFIRAIEAFEVPVLVGMQLVLAFLAYDIASVPRAPLCNRLWR